LRGEKKISSSERERQLVEAWERAGLAGGREEWRAEVRVARTARIRVRSWKVRWVERMIEDIEW
jgi:hypothetical protein